MPNLGNIGLPHKRNTSIFDYLNGKLPHLSITVLSCCIIYVITDCPIDKVIKYLIPLTNDCSIFRLTDFDNYLYSYCSNISIWTYLNLEKPQYRKDKIGY